MREVNVLPACLRPRSPLHICIAPKVVKKSMHRIPCSLLAGPLFVLVLLFLRCCLSAHQPLARPQIAVYIGAPAAHCCKFRRAARHPRRAMLVTTNMLRHDSSHSIAFSDKNGKSFPVAFEAANAAGDAPAVANVLRSMVEVGVAPPFSLAVQAASVISSAQGSRAVDLLFLELLEKVDWKWTDLAKARLESHLSEPDIARAIKAANDMLCRHILPSKSTTKHLLDSLYKKGMFTPQIKILLRLLEHEKSETLSLYSKCQGLGACLSVGDFEAYLTIAKSIPTDKLLKNRGSLTAALSKLLSSGEFKEANQLAELIPLINDENADGLLMIMKARAHASYGWANAALQALGIAKELNSTTIATRLSLSIARSVVLYDAFECALPIALLGEGMDKAHIQPLVKAVFTAGSALLKHVPRQLRVFKPARRNNKHRNINEEVVADDPGLYDIDMSLPRVDILGDQGILEAVVDVPEHAKDIARRIIREELPHLLENVVAVFLDSYPENEATRDSDNIASTFGYLFDALRKVGMLDESIELLQLLSLPEHGNSTFIQGYVSNSVLRAVSTGPSRSDLLKTLQFLRDIRAPINAYASGTVLAHFAKHGAGTTSAIRILNLMFNWNSSAVLTPLAFTPAGQLASLEGFESLTRMTESLLSMSRNAHSHLQRSSTISQYDLQLGTILQCMYDACKKPEEIIFLQKLALHKHGWIPTMEAVKAGMDRMNTLKPGGGASREIQLMLEDARERRPNILSDLFIFNQTAACIMLRSYCKSDRAGVALEALDRAIKAYPNQKQETIADGILLCKDNFDKAIQLFQVLRRTRRYPGATVYTNMVLVAKEARRHQDMFSFFEEMLEYKVSPPGIAARAISQYFYERKDTEGAVRYWTRVWEFFPQLRSNSVTTRELILSYAANYDWESLKSKLIEVGRNYQIVLLPRNIKEILNNYVSDKDACGLRSLISLLATLGLTGSSSIGVPADSETSLSENGRSEPLPLGIKCQALAGYAVELAKFHSVEDMLSILELLPAYYWPQLPVANALIRADRTDNLLDFARAVLDSKRKINEGMFDVLILYAQGCINSVTASNADTIPKTKEAEIRALVRVLQQYSKAHAYLLQSMDTQQSYSNLIADFATLFPLEQSALSGDGSESNLETAREFSTAATEVQQQISSNSSLLLTEELRNFATKVYALVKADQHEAAMAELDELLSQEWRVEEDADSLDFTQLFNLWIHLSIKLNSFKNLARMTTLLKQVSLTVETASRVDLKGLAMLMKRAITASDWPTVVAVGQHFIDSVRPLLVESIKQYGVVLSSPSSLLETNETSSAAMEYESSDIALENANDRPFVAIQVPVQLQSGAQSLLEMYMVACVNSNKASIALNILLELRHLGLKVSWVALDGLVNALALNQDLVSTMVCLEMMFKSNLQPSNHALERVVNVAQAHDKLDLSLKFVGLAHSRRYLLSRNNYTRLLGKMLSTDDTARIAQMLGAVVDIVDPTDDKHVALVLLLLRMLDNAGLGDMSRDLQRHFQRTHHRKL